MIRLLRYALILVFLVAVAVWFAERPGSVTLNWQGWRIDTSAAILALFIAVLAVVTAMVYRLWLALRRAPKAMVTARRGGRRQRGYRALTQGMVAVAAGDAAEAMRQAQRADLLLGDPPLTMLLSAQAAQLSGDEAAARRYFTFMLDRPETAFLGVRGLLMQAERAGDRGAALALARRARELRPKTPWVLTTLFELQLREGQWREALATLDEAIKRGVMDQESGRRRRAVVMLGCGAEAQGAGRPKVALDYVRKAHGLAPDLVPATVRLVTALMGDGKRRAATRILHNAWAREPHPDLARLYAELAPDEDPVKSLRRFERLLSFNPLHTESQIAFAEAALAAKLWGKARTHLERAMDAGLTGRVCRLMAELEETENGDLAAGRQWLLRAASADPDPVWQCHGCGHVAAEWGSLCTKCETIDSLVWRSPERERGLIFGPPPAVSAAIGGQDDAHRSTGADGTGGDGTGGQGTGSDVTGGRAGGEGDAEGNAEPRADRDETKAGADNRT